jgi:RNA polymerase sigma-70 factor (ECF subfamily)
MKDMGQGNMALAVHLSEVRTNGEGRHVLQVQDRVIAVMQQVHVSLFRYLICLGVASHDVDEITQETYLKLYQHLLEPERDDENLRQWVFRVAHNLAVTQFRRNKFLVETDAETLTQLYERHTQPAPSPEDVLLESERTSRLLEAISGLSELQRECFHLRAEGFRYREIAEVLGVSLDSVKQSLHRVLKRVSGSSRD